MYVTEWRYVVRMAGRSQGLLLGVASLTATLVPICEFHPVLFVNLLDFQLEDHPQLYLLTSLSTAGLLYLSAAHTNVHYFTKQWQSFIGSANKTLTHAEIYCQELVVQEALCFAIGFVNVVYIVGFWMLSFVVLQYWDNETNYVVANIGSAAVVLGVARSSLLYAVASRS